MLNHSVLSPLLVKGVRALMQGEGLDGVAAQLAGLGLQAGGDVHLQGAVLALDGADLQLQACGVGLATVGG